MVSPAHAGKSGMVAILQSRHIQFDGKLTGVPHRLLSEGVACLLERFAGQGMKGQASLALGERPSLVHGIVVELPLETQVSGVELIAGGNDISGISRKSRISRISRISRVSRRTRIPSFTFCQLPTGHPPAGHRFANAVHVLVNTDDGPSVAPMHGLQMHHTADGVELLEVEEPPLPIRRIHHSPLVRAVDVGHALFEHHFLFVGAIDVARTEHRLPSTLHTTFGDREVVVPVALVNLRPFGHRARINRASFVEQAFAIGRHLVDDDRASPMFAPSEVSLSVLVPERAGVFPLLHLLHEVKGCPRATRVSSLCHEEPFVRGTEEDPELSVVMSDSRCPRASCIAFVRVPLGEIEAVIELGNQSPVHQIR